MPVRSLIGRPYRQRLTVRTTSQGIIRRSSGGTKLAVLSGPKLLLTSCLDSVARTRLKGQRHDRIEVGQNLFNRVFCQRWAGGFESQVHLPLLPPVAVRKTAHYDVSCCEHLWLSVH